MTFLRVVSSALARFSYVRIEIWIVQLAARGCFYKVLVLSVSSSRSLAVLRALTSEDIYIFISLLSESRRKASARVQRKPYQHEITRALLSASRGTASARVQRKPYQHERTHALLSASRGTASARVQRKPYRHGEHENKQPLMQVRAGDLNGIAIKVKVKMKVPCRSPIR
ncbi:hypothetical protein NDU88_003081 [Pleurodeles waltl]|uniref:Uncharacterized protein n=1 Tax=Pleurodeles waltl TaxID=8319 RepID=A0AAV7MPI8_PLEWA|nr:hypothetical protein NDU88_003081 [Pleurodeles waltl]